MPEEYDSPDYQRLVAELVKHCRCTRGPCDGVLAGGMCDDIQDDEPEDIEDMGWGPCGGE